MTGNDKMTNGTYSHDAGIIPRVLYQLFAALNMEGIDAAIKCSFIELYNEDLRDLIADDDTKKITITDSSAARKSTGVTRGQESVFISSAAHGLEVLQHGLRKRQVAETKMNDLSSRSHTIFTLTVYMGMRNGPTKTTEALVNDACIVGKVNLVDLAGSENIGKSGAENKRAREAGMINQSLLTLGRVINALVDKSPHIPYRESKLTRLLQDSLGGQTKTCIIATISPAQINVEETLSTLEYASKAKSIKNKAQVGSLISKTTLFKEWSNDLIRLRRDWDATRKKNGTYLTEEHYKELLSENDERQLRIDEQERKLLTVDSQLRSSREFLEATKIQLIEAKKQLTSTSNTLSSTMCNLASTEEDLRNTKSSLSRETKARKAHAVTEASLAKIGEDLISKLNTTVADLTTLYDAVERHEQLDAENEKILANHGKTVNNSYSQLETILTTFNDQNETEMKRLQEEVKSFKTIQSEKLDATAGEIDIMIKAMEEECEKLAGKNKESAKDIHAMIEGLENARNEIKARITEGLGGLGEASQQVATDLATQVAKYKQTSKAMLSELGHKCDQMFSELRQHSEAQALEITRLNGELVGLTKEAVQESQTLVNDSMARILQDEETAAAREREEMLQQFQKLLADKEQAQQARLQARLQNEVRAALEVQQGSLTTATKSFEAGMDQVQARESSHLQNLLTHETALAESVSASRQFVDQHATELDATGSRMREQVQRAIEREGLEVSNQLQTGLEAAVSQVAAQNEKQQAELVQRYLRLDEYVRGGLKSVQGGVRSASESVGEQAIEAAARFETRVKEAWSALVAESSAVASTSREAIAKVKYLTDSDCPKPERRVIEYPRELPTTSLSTPASTAAPVTDVPLLSQPAREKSAAAEVPQRSPLSDISQHAVPRNEGGGSADVPATGLKEPLLKEPLKKRRPGYLSAAFSPSKKRSKTDL